MLDVSHRRLFRSTTPAIVVLIIKQESGGFSTPIDVVTDAKALHEVLISPMEPKPSDLGCLLWLKWLRECHQSKVLRKPYWVSTGDMVGDGLTKDKETICLTLRNLFRTCTIISKYTISINDGIIDEHKGRPPTKKEKE